MNLRSHTFDRSVDRAALLFARGRFPLERHALPVRPMAEAQPWLLPEIPP